jgi:hypothetical protein
MIFGQGKPCPYGKSTGHTMPTDLETLVAQIMQSKKYRGVSEDTIRDILITERARQPN